MDLLPIDGTFAREVRGVGLWEMANGDAVREAFSEHPVLVFRRQALTEDELIAFGRLLGGPEAYIERSWHSSKAEVSIVSNMRNALGDPVGGLASKELHWHTDQSYNADPVTGCFLYAQVVPEAGSRTSWANLYGAYDALPDRLRQRLDGLVGIFSYAARTGSVIRSADGQTVNMSYAERIRATPDVAHPLVNVHPQTGRKSLYIDPGTVTGIVGMPEDEARKLLEELRDVATRSGNVYDHQWRVGDLVLWDNAVTLHRRDAFADDQNRLMKRMIIRLPADTHIVPAVA